MNVVDFVNCLSSVDFDFLVFIFCCQIYRLFNAYDCDNTKYGKRLVK